MASTSFGVLITGDSKGAVKAIDLTSDELKKLEGATEKATRKVKAETDSTNSSFGSMASSAAKMGAAIAAAGVAVAGLTLRKVIQETSESEFAIAQLNATLAATGGAAGKSSTDLIAAANSMQKVTTFSDEAVLGVQGLLLAFKGIKGDTFDRTTAAVLDMATALKTDAPSAAKILGRALDDPITGLAKLSRAGVTFTDAQKEAITAMVEMGDKAGAQAIILDQLEGKFKGSAAAARDTLGGALESLSNTWGELFEASSTASSGMAASINELNATLSNPQIKAQIEGIVSGLISATNWAVEAAAALAWFFNMNSKQNLVDIADDIDRVTKALKDAQTGRTVDPVAAAGLAKELERLNKLYDAEVKAINGVTAAQTKGVASTVAATTATAANNNVVLLSSATKKKNAAETEKLTKEKEKLQDRIKKVNEEFDKGHKILDDMTAATREHIDSLKFETSQLGLSERQQFINNELRKEGTDITKAERAELELVAAAHYDAAKAAGDAAQASADAAQATEQAWSDARATLSNFFFEFAKDGKNAFDTLVEGFKAMLSKMAAEAAANVIIVGVRGVFPGAASLMSGTAAAGTSATSGGSSLLQGGLSGISGGITAGGQALYESIGNLASNAGMTGIGDMAYTKGLNTTGWTIGADIAGGFLGGIAGSKVFGETSGIGATAGGIAGSILVPIPGLGAAIGSFIGTGLEKAASKLFGQDNDGNNNAAADFNLGTGSVTGRTWGNSGGDVNAVVALVDPLMQLAEAIGGSSLGGNVTLGRKGIDYGGQNFGQDSAAFFAKAFKDVISSATELDEKLKPIILGFEGTAEEMAQFAVSLAQLSTETGGIKDNVLDLITSFEGASNQVVQFAAAIISLDQQSGINTVTNAIAEFARIVPSASTAYETHTQAIRDQIRAFDGTAESATTLAQSLLENKVAAYEFAMSIQTIGKAISEIASSQAESIRESVLTTEELTRKRIAERDALNKALSNLSDPQAVEETSRRILELNRQIFDSLSEDQQKMQVETFAKLAENTNTVAQSILAQTLDGLKITQDDINIRVSQMLAQASQSQQNAANTQQAAATQFAAAVDQFAANNSISITVQQPESLEVNV